ncbi:MAG TPA: (d)CMP kinase, partial [Nitrospiria bacterium]
GTVVFPEAHIKFFLEAAPDIRVRRRHEELRERGLSEEMAKTQSEIHRRDWNDSRRELAPLRPADDAIRIDSSQLSLVQVVEFMEEAIRKKAAPRG